MIEIFHGTDEATHEAFQAWRRSHPDGFNLSEGRRGSFTAHWTEDSRDNGRGRGCMHQGGSSNRFNDAGVSCMTTAKKVCSESLAELLEWAACESVQVKYCKHCDSRAYPLPVPNPSGPNAA
jgi:hypothetical protein